MRGLDERESGRKPTLAEQVALGLRRGLDSLHEPAKDERDACDHQIEGFIERLGDSIAGGVAYDRDVYCSFDNFADRAPCRAYIEKVITEKLTAAGVNGFRFDFEPATNMHSSRFAVIIDVRVLQGLDPRPAPPPAPTIRYAQIVCGHCGHPLALAGRHEEIAL